MRDKYIIKQSIIDDNIKVNNNCIYKLHEEEVNEMIKYFTENIQIIDNEINKKKNSIISLREQVQKI